MDFINKEDVPYLHPIILPLVPCPFWCVPSQVGMGSTPARSEPHPRMGDPCQIRRWVPWGALPFWGGVPPPQIGQKKEYLLRGGRYVSCVHPGGLPCFAFALICTPMGKSSVESKVDVAGPNFRSRYSFAFSVNLSNISVV